MAGGDDFEPFAQLVVVDVDGAVRFSATRPFDYRGSGSSNHLGGRADGLFVHTMLETKEQLGLVVHHGEADDLGGPNLAIASA